MNLLLVVGVGFFLLLVGALLGRYYVPDRRPLKRAAEEGRAYVRGLVELLEGDSDAAIGEIRKALRDNTKTVEAYFALGTLFRGRGEHERAVRVHQALLTRRDLDKKTRLRIHYQLAQDFVAAGFPRRAVKALEYLITQDRKHVAAMEQLARVYEETRQWQRAAALQRRLGKVARRDTAAIQAHLFAEQAREQIEAGKSDAARKPLRRALSADSESVHALHVAGLYQRQAGNPAAAVKAWRKAASARPDLVAFFLPPIEAALGELNKPEQVDELLANLLKRQPDDVHLRLAQARFDAKRNPHRALSALSKLLDEYPALLPARREAARLVLEAGDPAAIRQAFEQLLEVLGRADRGFRCQACGHAANELFWRCPACKRWDSVRTAWGRRAGEKAGR